MGQDANPSPVYRGTRGGISSRYRAHTGSYTCECSRLAKEPGSTPFTIRYFHRQKVRAAPTHDLPRHRYQHGQGLRWIRSTHGSHPRAHSTPRATSFGCGRGCHQHHVKLLKIKYPGYLSPFLLFICTHYGARAMTH